MHLHKQTYIYFEFDSNVFQQISGTTVGTKFDGCIFTDQDETKFLETKVLKSLVWFRYIDHVFVI